MAHHLGTRLFVALQARSYDIPLLRFLVNPEVNMRTPGREREPDLRF